jgi:hypothetical protein
MNNHKEKRFFLNASLDNNFFIDIQNKTNKYNSISKRVGDEYKRSLRWLVRKHDREFNQWVELGARNKFKAIFKGYNKLVEPKTRNLRKDKTMNVKAESQIIDVATSEKIKSTMVQTLNLGVSDEFDVTYQNIRGYKTRSINTQWTDTISVDIYNSEVQACQTQLLLLKEEILNLSSNYDIVKLQEFEKTAEANISRLKEMNSKLYYDVDRLQKQIEFMKETTVDNNFLFKITGQERKTIINNTELISKLNETMTANNFPRIFVELNRVISESRNLIENDVARNFIDELGLGLKKSGEVLASVMQVIYSKVKK